jgi:ParB family chromosome partitioning protein
MASTNTIDTTSLPLSKIKPGDNPRRYFDQVKHGELVASLHLRGMLQPILLRPAGDGYVVIAGERRYRAAIEAFGPEGDVPVIIREMTDQEALEAAIDENDVREDASETEQADAAVRVLAACQGDRGEAAKRLGWSQGKLDRRLALAKLSEAVKVALDERRIKVGHAELLAAVPSDKQDKALDTILSAGLDVSKTREILMRVTQSLAGAMFDKTECTKCPFNSGTQRALFETHVEEGHCTNPGCYQLKTEGAGVAPPVDANSGAAGGEAKPAGIPADDRPSTPDSPADPCPGQPDAPAKALSQKPAKVDDQSFAAKLKPVREMAWRHAVGEAIRESADHLRVADLAASFVTSEQPMSFVNVDALHIEFEVDLRDTWRVDQAFLSRFGKDELKFIANECGLIEHMGAKAFAKLLDGGIPALIAGMLNAKGFSWAGRLPSAMTIDGKYGPPPHAAPVATSAPAEKV